MSEETVTVKQETETNETNGSGAKAATTIHEHNEQVQAEEEKNEAQIREEEINQAREDLEKLDPNTGAVRWLIGKGPEYGGNPNDYRVFTQEKLPWIPRGKFFSLVSRTFSDAIKVSGGEISGMEDIFGEGGGSLIERGRRLSSRDFTDATSFMSLAFELVSYAPDFLLDCYCLWLNVARDDRTWAKEHFSEPWNPENDQWGLTDEQHEQIINNFIDQNYEDIRRFFVVVLPGMGKRIALHERAKDRQNSRK